MKVLQFPLVRITIWLVLGILCSYYTNPSLKFAFFTLFIATVLFIINYILNRRNLISNIFFGLTLYVMTFSIGVTTFVINSGYNQSDNFIHFVNFPDKEYFIKATLREKLNDSKLFQRYIAQVKSINSLKCTGKILINFQKQKTDKPFIIGNIIYLKSKVILHQNPKNPSQFDYGNYLTQKSILAQIFIYNNQYIVSKKIEKNIWFYADQIRLKIINNLKNNGFKNQELNTVAALILGQRQDISPEIINDYQYSGAIHILSVSGLHVGYLFLTLTFLMSGLPRTKFFEHFKLISILLALWGFSVLSGFTPSVIRSVTMFSIITIGMFLNRKTNIYNTICISMFFILLFEPSFLFDIGFQLSFVAVFFIIWLYPLLKKIWSPKNKFIKYFWEIFAVSIAAQIGTLPISLYYFHQFPGLFFITNLIVLPALGFIMILGVLVMFLALFNIVPYYLEKLLEWSIYLLNSVIHWIASFDYFIIKNIPFNGLLLVTAYLIIISMIFWIEKPTSNKFKLVLITVFILQMSYFISVLQKQHSDELIVFNFKKKTIIGEKLGNKIIIATNDSISENSILKSYIINNFNPKIIEKKLQNVLFFNGKKVLILDHSGVLPITTIKPDILLITNSPRINLERIVKQFKPKMIVADASNYKNFIKKWEATCREEKIPFHNTSEKGFYRLN